MQNARVRASFVRGAEQRRSPIETPLPPTSDQEETVPQRSTDPITAPAAYETEGRSATWDARETPVSDFAQPTEEVGAFKGFEAPAAMFATAPPRPDQGPFFKATPVNETRVPLTALEDIRYYRARALNKVSDIESGLRHLAELDDPHATSCAADSLARACSVVASLLEDVDRTLAQLEMRDPSGLPEKKRA